MNNVSRIYPINIKTVQKRKLTTAQLWWWNIYHLPVQNNPEKPNTHWPRSHSNINWDIEQANVQLFNIFLLPSSPYLLKKTVQCLTWMQQGLILQQHEVLSWVAIIIRIIMQTALLLLTYIFLQTTGNHSGTINYPLQSNHRPIMRVPKCSLLNPEGACTLWVIQRFTMKFMKSKRGFCNWSLKLSLSPSHHHQERKRSSDPFRFRGNIKLYTTISSTSTTTTCKDGYRTRNKTYQCMYCTLMHHHTLYRKQNWKRTN